MQICTQKNWSCANNIKLWTWCQLSILSLTGESEEVFNITWQPLLNAGIECCGYSARRTLAWGWGDEGPSSSWVACKHVPTALKCLSVHSPEIIVTHLFVKFYSRTFSHMSSIIIFLFFSFFFYHCNDQVYILLLLKQVAFSFPVLRYPLMGNIWHFP